MQIEVFADVWCPFTHVGLRAVVDTCTAAGRDDVEIIVRSWPLEWVNGAPMEREKVEHHAVDLRDQVTPDLFTDIADPFPRSTLSALALVVRAYSVSAAAGLRASLLVRDALFERGLDTDDVAVLEGLAAELGVGMPTDSDREQVRADWERGRALGVLGSPHFFCGDAGVFCPSLEITRDPETGLVIHRSTDRLLEFVEACLGS